MTLAETSLLEEPFCRPQPIQTPVVREPTRERGGARDVIVPIPADFRLAFGEEPGPLTSIAVMTDSDNSRASARAWYGPVELK